MPLTCYLKRNSLRCNNILLCIISTGLIFITSCTNALSNDDEPYFPKPMKEGVAYVFDIEAIPEINITIKSDDWNLLLEKYDANKYVKDYIKCDFSFNKNGKTTHISEDGLKLHGNTSRIRPEGVIGQKHDECAKFNHCHYMVNLRKYVKDDEHELEGVRKMNLKWFHNDPSYVREIYCYDLFKRYNIWTISDCSYCRISLQVNEETPVYLGVYGMFETVDKQYLNRRKELFGSSSGFLWKCTGVGLNDISDNLFSIDDNTVDHPYELKEETDEFDAAKEQFQSFINKFQTLEGESFINWIESVCDVNLLLKTYAVNVAVGMWD